MSIILNSNNANELFDNANTQLKNIKDNNSSDRNKNNSIDIKENLMEKISDNKNWNLEGTVWHIGLPCDQKSKFFSVPPCNGPYPNYQLTIKNLNGENISTVKTDLNGKFRIFLEPSSYIITAQDMQDFKFTIEQNNITRLDKELVIDTGLE